MSLLFLTAAQGMVERGIFPFWLLFEQLPKHRSTFFFFFSWKICQVQLRLSFSVRFVLLSIWIRNCIPYSLVMKHLEIIWEITVSHDSSVHSFWKAEICTLQSSLGWGFLGQCDFVWPTPPRACTSFPWGTSRCCYLWNSCHLFYHCTTLRCR